MLKLREIAPRKIEEAMQQSTLPALLVLKRGAVRTLSNGRKVAEYHHAETGETIIYPMMWKT